MQREPQSQLSPKHVSSPVQQQQAQHAQRAQHPVSPQHLAVPAQATKASQPGTDRQHSGSGRVAAPALNSFPAVPASVKAAVEPEAEPEVSSTQALVSLADLLEDAATDLDGKHQLQSGMSLRLLAIQVLLAAVRKQKTVSTCQTQDRASQPQQQQQQHELSAVSSDDGKEAQQQQQQEQQRVLLDSHEQKMNAQQAGMGSKHIKQRLQDLASKVEESLGALQQEGESSVVPYVWQVVYEAALSFACAGATQEIIGGLASCISPYSKVGQCIHKPPACCQDMHFHFVSCAVKPSCSAALHAELCCLCICTMVGCSAHRCL